MNNTCDFYQELISRMLDDELNNQERAVLAEHLSTCRECADLYSAFSLLSEAVASDLEDPPEELAEEVMAHIRRAEIKKQNRRMPRQVKNLIAVAACIALLVSVAGGVMVIRSSRSGTAIYETRMGRNAAAVSNGADSQIDSTVLAPVAEAPAVQNTPADIIEVPVDNWTAALPPTAAPLPPQTAAVPAPAEMPSAFAPTKTPRIAPYSTDISGSDEQDSGITVIAPAAQTPSVTEVPEAAPADTGTGLAAEAPPAVEVPASTEVPAVQAPEVSASPSPVLPAVESAVPEEASVPAEAQTPEEQDSLIESNAEENPEQPAEASALPPDPAVGALPITEYDFSQKDCTALIQALFGLETEQDSPELPQESASAPENSPEESTSTDASETEPAAVPSPTPALLPSSLPNSYAGFSYIEKLISDQVITPCELPADLTPSRLDMLALSQDDLYFVLQIAVQDDSIYIFTYSSSGDPICFEAAVTTEEFDALLEAYTLSTEAVD